MAITPAKELTFITTEDIVDMFCDKLMQKIKSENDKGHRKTCFYTGSLFLRDGELVPYPKGGDLMNAPSYLFDDYKDAIALKFREAGYRIQPTGYIGGVWQQTEDIIW